MENAVNGAVIVLYGDRLSPPSEPSIAQRDVQQPVSTILQQKRYNFYYRREAEMCIYAVHAAGDGGVRSSLTVHGRGT